MWSLVWIKEAFPPAFCKCLRSWVVFELKILGITKMTMDDKNEHLDSGLLISEEKGDNLYPVCLGVSCAFFALRILSIPDFQNEKWPEIKEKMIQGSAQLLGLLIWRVQREKANYDGQSEIARRLEIAKREIEELKRIRREDARANQKVVSLFAEQEQCWFRERKSLQQQIGALMNELRVLEKKRDDAISELNENIKAKDLLIESKEKTLGEEIEKRKECEENLKKVSIISEELRESVRREVKEHSSELWKHKTAFIELVSNQRQLEAEMGRALRQVEAAKRELDSVHEQKQEAELLVQNLSMEVVKACKDSEQKDQILSAMLRKSKLDTSEKQMLLKEIKLSKVKKKQAEMETERWRAVSGTINDRHSLRSMSKHAYVNFSPADSPQVERIRSQTNDHPLDHGQPELQVFSPVSSDYSSSRGNEEEEDMKRLESWVRLEAEKYMSQLEQKHLLEIDAFAEQMRIKHETVEAYRWQLLSMELESKRLQTHVEGLNQDMTRLREINTKLEALLEDREAELQSLKQKIALQLIPQILAKTDDGDISSVDLALGHDANWSETQETKTSMVELPEEAETREEEPSPDRSKDIILTVENEFSGEEKDVQMDTLHVLEEGSKSGEVENAGKLVESTSEKNSSWKMDLPALTVSYKIKRLNQQFLMLERFLGKQETTDCSTERKSFMELMRLLNKQVSRYQSLQRKTDELCIRMHESDGDINRGKSNIKIAKEETKILENFLEETIHLQRYMVATGQKLVEIQSKVASGFAGIASEVNEESCSSYNMSKFAENIKKLFMEVQRGLEVRISRMIGNLEGTLACDGIIHLGK